MDCFGLAGSSAAAGELHGCRYFHISPTSVPCDIISTSIKPSESLFDAKRDLSPFEDGPENTVECDVVIVLLARFEYWRSD